MIAYHQSRLAGVAASVSLTAAQAVVAPAVFDKFVEATTHTVDSMLRELELNAELADYFGQVCRNVAESDAGRKVARDFEASR